MSIPGEYLSWLGKLVCGRIGSYGVKGCYESNQTMARYFGVSRRAIVFAAAQIRSLPLTYSIKRRGVPTCYWLRCSAEVQAAEYLTFRGLSMSNPAHDQRKYCAGGEKETAQVPAQETAHNYKTTSKTTGATSPSPADGQAQRRQKEEAVAWSGIWAGIWPEIVRHLPPAPAGDWEAKQHQVLVIAEFEGKAKKLAQDGMSVPDIVREVLGEQFVKAREESL